MLVKIKLLYLLFFKFMDGGGLNCILPSAVLDQTWQNSTQAHGQSNPLAKNVGPEAYVFQPKQYKKID